MSLRLVVAVTLAAGLVLVPAPASAKGVKDMTVTGPGLPAPIRLANDGRAPVPPNAVVQGSGLFWQGGDRLTEARPSGNLGPRYVATYAWLTGPDETTPLRQELYPFADGGPVSYTRPEQRVTELVLRGGWYRADPGLTLLLVAVGVPVPAGSAPPAPIAAPPRLTG